MQDFPHILDIAVRLVNFWPDESRGSLLLLALFYKRTPSCLKVGGGAGGGGLCDYCVSPSPFDLDFETLDFGTSTLGLAPSYSPSKS